jgi:hypothetical protein
MFNNLSTNSYVSSPQVPSTNKLNYFNELKNLKMNKNFTLVSYLLNSTNLNFNGLTHKKYPLNFSLKTFTSLKTENTSYHFKLKDVNLNYLTESGLTQENLNILYWLTIPSNNLSDELSLFNYLNSSNTKTFTSSQFFNEKPLTPALNYWLLYSLLDVDSIYLNDIQKLSNL